MIPRVTSQGNSMLQTLHSETNFLETNFPNKLILHSFQCIICTNIPHRVHDHQQKRNFPFFDKGFQNFCVKLCYEHYKKINLQFFVFTWHFFSLWIDLDLDLDNLKVRVVSSCTGTQRNETLTNCVTTPCMDVKTIGIPPCTGTPGQPRS